MIKLVGLTERERLAALRVLLQYQAIEPRERPDLHLAGAIRSLEAAHRWDKAGRITFGLSPAYARILFTHLDGALRTGMISERRAVNYAKWFTRRLRLFLDPPKTGAPHAP